MKHRRYLGAVAVAALLLTGFLVVVPPQPIAVVELAGGKAPSVLPHTIDDGGERSCPTTWCDSVGGLPIATRECALSDSMTCPQVRRTVALFKVARVKHFPSSWHGAVELWSDAHDSSRAWVHIRMERARHADEMLDDIVDITSPAVNHSAHAPWVEYVRNVAGPDAFYAVLVGPEIIALATERNTSNIMSTNVEYVLRSTRPLELVRDGGAAAVEYVLHVQQHHYNYGAVHDRDRFGAPFRPRYVVGKHDGHGRAGAIKLARQKLKFSRITQLNSGDGDMFHAAVTLTPDGLLQMSVAPAAARHGVGSDSVGFPSPPPASTLDAPHIGPLCSLRAGTRQRSDQHCDTCISGKYTALPPVFHAPYQGSRATPIRNASLDIRDASSLFLDIRGWTVDQEHPIRGRRYAWVSDDCRTMPMVGLAPLQAAEEEVNASSSEVRNTNIVAAGEPSPTSNHRGKATQLSVLAKCFASKAHKVLFLGDSQLRSLFHTAVSLLTLRKALQGKLSHARLQVTSTVAAPTPPPPLSVVDSDKRRDVPFGLPLVCRHRSESTTTPSFELCTDETSGHPICPPSRTETVLGCTHSPHSRADTPPLLFEVDGEKERRGVRDGRQRHHNSADQENPSPPPLRGSFSRGGGGGGSFVEMIWDPLLLNLSYFSRQGHRQRIRFAERAATSLLHRRRSLSHWNESVQVHHSGDDADDAAALPLARALAQEEDEDANVRLQGLLDDYNTYGPDAAYFKANSTHGPIGAPGGFDLLVASLLGDESVDTLVLGFGGWFGLHLWGYGDVEAHLADIVDALVHVSELRHQLNKPPLLILLAGTPAWPSYVTWDGHRRNTNSRLGIITQLTRAAFASPQLRRLAPVVTLPFFEMSYPVSHLRFHDKDIHYDRSMVVYSMLEVIGTLLCAP